MYMITKIINLMRNFKLILIFNMFFELLIWILSIIIGSIVIVYTIICKFFDKKLIKCKRGNNIEHNSNKFIW